MDPKDLKKYLAGLGIAGLLAGGTALAADTPLSGDDKTRSTPSSTATTTGKDTKAPAKSS